ncbi:MAG: DUF4249 domain-containing protein [Cyclobacteriaceae bacterium]
MFAILITGACVEPYDPPVNDEDVRFLVVDGFINASNGVASVTLTRTQPVASDQPPPAESGAKLSIEDKNGLKYQLSESGNGMYSGIVPNVNFETQYRLLITTNNDRQYTSVFISLQQTPAIDSISYRNTKDGLELSVSAHDITGQSKYYRWKYIETYEYNSDFNSEFMFTSAGVVDYRPPSQFIYTCWKTTRSTNILVGSTERLKESVVSRFPLTVIPDGAKQLSRKYSILIRQQTLSLEGYNYWLNLQKSTERLGGLFDPLPSEVSGNLQSVTNPEQTVIGFFGGGTVDEKRIFITPADLPDEMGPYNYRNPFCVVDTILVADLGNYTSSTYLVGAIYPIRGPVIGYTTSAKPCVDCRDWGGVTVKPDFWD